MFFGCKIVWRCATSSLQQWRKGQNFGMEDWKCTNKRNFKTYRYHSPLDCSRQNPPSRHHSSKKPSVWEAKKDIQGDWYPHEVWGYEGSIDYSLWTVEVAPRFLRRCLNKPSGNGYKMSLTYQHLRQPTNPFLQSRWKWRDFHLHANKRSGLQSNGGKWFLVMKAASGASKHGQGKWDVPRTPTATCLSTQIKPWNTLQA